MNQTNQKHLPFFGVGPIYVISILLMTMLARYLSNKRIIYIGLFEELGTIMNILALLLIAAGVMLYGLSLFRSDIVKGLKENRLVTHGVYAYVRNPIYSAWIFICTGILLLGHDIWAFVLCPIFWAYLTVLMKHTEEKWLSNQYGQQYLDYMKKVNRVFPWFPRR